MRRVASTLALFIAIAPAAAQRPTAAGDILRSAYVTVILERSYVEVV